MNPLPAICPRDLTDSRVVFERAPHEAALDHGLYPITETEWLQLAARQIGLAEHRPTGTQAASTTTLMEHRK